MLLRYRNILWLLDISPAILVEGATAERGRINVPSGINIVPPPPPARVLRHHEKTPHKKTTVSTVPPYYIRQDQCR